MPPPRRLSLMPGVRPVAGDAATIMQKRLPQLPKSQATDDLMAVEPLQVVLAGYGERAGEALERAKLFQAGEPLQYLDEGRWHPNKLEGTTGTELPLLAYPGSVIPGTRGGVAGLFRHSPDKASIQIAESEPGLYPLLREESLHALDRRARLSEKPLQRFQAPSSFAALLEKEPHPRAVALMRYFEIPAETRATLSGLLGDAGKFINTSDEAVGLLEQARDTVPTVREAATAEAILNSRTLRNEYIPYLLKALSAGGVAAGTTSMED